MPEPKKQSSARKTGLRRSHLRLKLARTVNKRSPVKAFETAKKTPNLRVKTVKKSAKAEKATAKKSVAKPAKSGTKKSTNKKSGKK